MKGLSLLLSLTFLVGHISSSLKIIISSHLTTWWEGSSMFSSQLQSWVSSQPSNLFFPDLGIGWTYLKWYPLETGLEALFNGMATTVKWSEGFPDLGLSGWTGGTVIGFAKSCGKFVRMTSSILSLCVIGIIVICHNLLKSREAIK